MKEYKPIPGFEKYGISTDGELKNFRTGNTFRGGPGRKGYYMTTLTDSNGKNKPLWIHQLMAITYLGHIRCGMKMVVDHIDNNRSNNCLENLQLITNRENATKDKKKGTSKYPGVSWQPQRARKWVAYIYMNGKLKNLGTFSTEEQAAEAYQTALRNHLSGSSDI